MEHIQGQYKLDATELAWSQWMETGNQAQSLERQYVTMHF